MDFLVCGMPRGGTTFFGQLFNVHEDIYCYFMESSLVRHMFMFGRDRPFPPENLPVLEQWLRTELRPTLVDGTRPERVATFRRLVKFQDMLRKHGLDEISGPGIRVWNEFTFEPFLQDLVAMYRSGAYGDTLFVSGMQLLRRHLCSVTGRSVIGEKTPDNLFHIEALQNADPSLTGLCILREPYSTLESMKRRALRSESFFDSAFSTDVLRGIAEYYRHISAAHSCAMHAEPGRFHVYRFEDLVRDPASVMEQAYAALGLQMTAAAADILPRLSLPTDKRHIIDLGLAAEEYRLIEWILGPMLRHFGYPAPAAAGGPGDAGRFEEAIIPLAGIHADADLGAPINYHWMSRRAELFLVFGADRSRLVLDLKFLFPEAFGNERIELRVTSSGRELAVCEATPICDELRLEVPLGALRDSQSDAPVSGALLTLQSSDSYAPITIPGLGFDVRDVSFLIKSCAYA